jgi:hypothetical protein
MEENRNAHGVLVGKPVGEKLLGRPGRRREDIKMELNRLVHGTD